MLFGISINNNILENIPKTKKIGCSILQIFAEDAIVYNKNLQSQIKKELIKYNLKCVIHSSYAINMASDYDEYAYSFNRFIDEIIMASEIEAFGIVIHMGKHKSLSINKALNNMYQFLLEIHNKTIEYKTVKILLETSTGQGTEMCYKLEDLAHFFNKFAFSKDKIIRDRFKITIDTCHIFNAGYNLKSIKGIDTYLSDFDKLIGLKHINLIHLNDSKNDVGMHKDRHERLGKGYIGKKNILYIIHFFKSLNVPIVLETPTENISKEIDEYFIKNK